MSMLGKVVPEVEDVRSISKLDHRLRSHWKLRHRSEVTVPAQWAVIQHTTYIGGYTALDVAVVTLHGRYDAPHLIPNMGADYL
jgi:hypothetical protein